MGEMKESFVSNTVKRRTARWMLAIGLIAGACGLLHASDSDGDSGFDGAFLTLTGNVIHNHLALRSFKVTPSTRAAFVMACAHGKRIWINSRSAPCLSAEAKENDSAVQVEVSLDTDKSLSGSYYLVSVRSSAYASLRDLTEQERSALPHITTASLGHARAVNGRNRSLIFVPYGKDRDGNRLTYVFSVVDGQAAYVGKLPDWPEKLITIGHKDAPQVILNLKGDARVILVYSIWPRVAVEMFAGEGA
jgi:hypothetical protein